MVSRMISLPGTELQVSRIISGVMNWGVWGKNLSPQEMNRLIHLCLENGITTFDHADIYGHYTTEASFGAALQLSPGLSDQIQLISKCGIKLTTPNRPAHQIKSYDTSKEHILASVDQTLRNLGVDQIDLLLIHRPSPLMDANEIAEAFSTLKEAGKVGAFGASNFTPRQMDLLANRVELVTNQVKANVLHLDPFFDGTFDWCQQHRVPPMIWSPAAGGAIFRNPEVPQHQRILNTLATVGEAIEESNLEKILLAWLIAHPARLIPVIGTTNPWRIQAAAQSIQCRMSREQWFMILEAAYGQEVA